jgi:hypothetical protein
LRRTHKTDISGGYNLGFRLIGSGRLILPAIVAPGRSDGSRDGAARTGSRTVLPNGTCELETVWQSGYVALLPYSGPIAP